MTAYHHGVGMWVELYLHSNMCLNDVHRDNLLTSTVFQCIRNCFTCNDIHVNRNDATVILFGLQVLLGF